jgi:hypothetical protein
VSPVSVPSASVSLASVAVPVDESVYIVVDRRRVPPRPRPAVLPYLSPQSPEIIVSRTRPLLGPERYYTSCIVSLGAVPAVDLDWAAVATRLRCQDRPERNRMTNVRQSLRTVSLHIFDGTPKLSIAGKAINA